MSKNWKKVNIDPAFGCCNVSCSRVIALLQQPPNMSDVVVTHEVRAESIVEVESKGQLFHKHGMCMIWVKCTRRLVHDDTTTRIETPTGVARPTLESQSLIE